MKQPQSIVSFFRGLVRCIARRIVPFRRMKWPSARVRGVFTFKYAAPGCEKIIPLIPRLKMAGYTYGDRVVLMRFSDMNAMVVAAHCNMSKKHERFGALCRDRYGRVGVIGFEPAEPPIHLPIVLRSELSHDDFRGMLSRAGFQYGDVMVGLMERDWVRISRLAALHGRESLLFASLYRAVACAERGVLCAK